MWWGEQQHGTGLVIKRSNYSPRVVAIKRRQHTCRTRTHTHTANSVHTRKRPRYSTQVSCEHTAPVVRKATGNTWHPPHRRVEPHTYQLFRRDGCSSCALFAAPAMLRGARGFQALHRGASRPRMQLTAPYHLRRRPCTCTCTSTSSTTTCSSCGAGCAAPAPASSRRASPVLGCVRPRRAVTSASVAAASSRRRHGGCSGRWHVRWLAAGRQGWGWRRGVGCSGGVPNAV